MMMYRAIILLMCVSVFPCCGETVWAADGQVLRRFDLSVSKFAIDPNRDLLYATVPATNSLAIFRTDTLALVDSFFIGSNPRGLTVSPESRYVYGSSE